MKNKETQPTVPEPDWNNNGWKHPYVIYILLSIALVTFLVVMGWLAKTQGWLPNSGT